MSVDDKFHLGSGLGLGKQQDYVEQYAPELLRPIPRHLSRQQLSNCPSQFIGIDVWTAYELSWLDDNGRPVVAIAEIRVPVSSPNIIESKSFKYYLNSFNQTPVSSREALQVMLESDLTDVAGATVGVQLFDLDSYAQMTAQHITDASICVDQQVYDDVRYTPSPDLLRVKPVAAVNQNILVPGNKRGQQILKSHLLKSNCPVTGQPDWATVWVGCSGVEINPASFAAYIVSFRQHQDFHENCVERIFTDIQVVCKPEAFWVYARYTRRGGLDINPFRSSRPMSLPQLHGPRQ